MDRIDQLPAELFQLLLEDYVFPSCGARLVQKLRLLSHAWNDAFIAATQPVDLLAKSQPTRGGSVAIGFLLDTYPNHRRALVGLRRSIDTCPSLHTSFGVDRSPKVVATSNGYLCILLTEPSELVIWNPIRNQRTTVFLPHNIPALYQIQFGMNVSLDDGVGTLAIVCHNEEVGQGLPWGGWVSSWLWTSENQAWVHQGNAVIFQGAYDPGNSITVNDRIHFLVSPRSVVWTEFNQWGSIPIPEGERVECICTYQGRVALCKFDFVGGAIRIHREGWHRGLWDPAAVIELVPLIRRYTTEFRFNSCATRRSIPHNPRQVLIGSRIIGCSDDWVFMFQQGKLVRISCITNTVKRLNINRFPEAPNVFFPCSSFLELGPWEEEEEN